MDATQVAVYRFGRVKKMAPRAGRGQRGGDLLADQAGLADASDDHAAAALVEFIRRAAELRVEPPAETLNCLGLDLDYLPGIAELFRRAER